MLCLLAQHSQPTNQFAAQIYHPSQPIRSSRENVVVCFLIDENVFHDLYRSRRKRELIAVQFNQQIDLLFRCDPQLTVEPKVVYTAADVSVAVMGRIDVVLHTSLTDTPRHLLIKPDSRVLYRIPHILVLIPRGNHSLDAIPLQDFHLVPHCARFGSLSKILGNRLYGV
jgi:hypothetical protein